MKNKFENVGLRVFASIDYHIVEKFIRPILIYY